MKSKLVFIGGDARSGGSLLARLLDSPPDYLSFPLELEYFSDRNGELFDLSRFLQTRNIKDVFEKEIVVKLLKFAEGKLMSKQFYDRDTLFLDKSAFEEKLKKKLGAVRDDADEATVFETVALAFFETFLKKELEPAVITNHCSKTFLADLERFFDVFPAGYFVHTIREPLSVAASLKNYSYPILKKQNEVNSPLFIEMFIERWIIGLWHALNNKIKYGERYIILNYETLIRDPGNIMKILCDILGIPFNEAFLKPTIGEELWSGNSSFGALPKQVSFQTLERYREAFSKEEIDKIKEATKPELFHLDTISFAESINGSFFEVDELARKILLSDYEIKLSRKYFNHLNEEMTKLQIG